MLEMTPDTRTMGPLVLTLTVLALLGSALVAGIFYAFSAFVMPALGRIPADRGMAAMQSINITAVRPAFMSVLFGTALICLALGVCAVRGWARAWALPVLVGALCYLVGAILLTIVVHVPLNDALAGVDPASPAAGPAWADYLRRWNPPNQARWILPLASSALLTLGVLRA